VRILITGSSGLIGSEAVEYFDKFPGVEIIGIDNNSRKEFFGEEGDTSWNLKRLQEITSNFKSADMDIRDRGKIFDLFVNKKFDLILHFAAQPAHDYSFKYPLRDFDVNCNGTVNLLEATRVHCPKATFIYTSTSKVYGDSVNEKPMVELEKRYEYSDPLDWLGISEKQRIDQNMHSVFGASKTAADIMVQEYGKYFGLYTACLRGACLTGGKHSGVELHGYLSYLVKCVLEQREYQVYGYKGKQVRDNIHSYDVVHACLMIYEYGRTQERCGEVYNLGSGRNNSVSVLEAFDIVEAMTGMKPIYKMHEGNRTGDHIIFIADITKFQQHYRTWVPVYNLERIFEDIINGHRARSK